MVAWVEVASYADATFWGLGGLQFATPRMHVENWTPPAL
jgi:hypothetical protein